MATKSSTLEVLHEQVARLEATIGGCDVGYTQSTRMAEAIKAHETQGLAKDVAIQTSEWKGMINLLSNPLLVFDFIWK